MRKALVPVLLSGILGTAVPTSADPIRTVTAGSISSNDDSSSFLLIGSGFRLSGGGPFISGPRPQCVIFIPCAPGTSIDLSTSVIPSPVGDPAVFDERAYGGYNYYGGVFFSGEFSINAGSITVPSFAEGTSASRSTPFTFTGVLTAYDNFELTGTPLFSTALQGRGTASIEFDNRAEFGGIFTSRFGYEFEDTAPVPEPATMFLLGSGLGGIALRRVRRRRS